MKPPPAPPQEGNPVARERFNGLRILELGSNCQFAETFEGLRMKLVTPEGQRACVYITIEGAHVLANWLNELLMDYPIEEKQS